MILIIDHLQLFVSHVATESFSALHELHILCDSSILLMPQTKNSDIRTEREITIYDAATTQLHTYVQYHRPMGKKSPLIIPGIILAVPRPVRDLLLL